MVAEIAGQECAPDVVVGPAPARTFQIASKSECYREGKTAQQVRRGVSLLR
jgi:hypothetical protein